MVCKIGKDLGTLLEYEKLDNHCSSCYSLSHLKRDCPTNLRDTPRAEQRGRQGAPEQRSRKVTPLPPRDGRSMPTKDLKAEPHSLSSPPSTDNRDNGPVQSKTSNPCIYKHNFSDFTKGLTGANRRANSK